MAGVFKTGDNVQTRFIEATPGRSHVIDGVVVDEFAPGLYHIDTTMGLRLKAQEAELVVTGGVVPDPIVTVPAAIVAAQANTDAVNANTAAVQVNVAAAQANATAIQANTDAAQANATALQANTGALKPPPPITP
jgi:hypothetical protein